MTLRLSVAELTAQQSCFVENYLNNGDVSASAKLAGYAHVNSGYAALRSPAVQRAIKDHIGRRLKIEGARTALGTMLELLKPGQPAGVRFQAAKYVLDAAGYGAKDADDRRDKPLAEMTETELASFIDKMQRAVEGGAEPPVIAIRPEPGQNPQGGPAETVVDQPPL